MHKTKLTIALSALMLSTASPACADAQSGSGTQPNMAPCISWKNPLMKPRFALLCIHGLGLYSKSYQDFAQRMIRHGAIVYAIDVRGFGSWMKAQGHADVDFKGCLEDIRTALVSIRQANPGLPVYLLGESMGGAIALRATSMYPELIDGLISSVPAEDRFKQKKTDLKVALEMLRGPKRDFDIGSQIVEQAATAERVEDGKKKKIVNQELQQAWEADPLNRMELSPKELIQFQAFMNDNHDAVKQINSTPVLFVQGLDDRLVKPEGTWDLVEEIRTPDRMFMALPSRHLIFEETQTADPRIKKASEHLVLAWINGHMRGDDTDPADYGSAQAGAASGASTASSPPVAPIPPAPQVTNGKPTIVAFYADWAQQCGSVDMVMDRSRTAYGDRVNCLKVDVNDPSSKDLIRLFNVGTVPTLVFLKADGTLSSTVIGETQPPNILKSVIAILGMPNGGMRPAAGMRQMGGMRPAALMGPGGGMKRRAQFRAIGK